MTNLQYNPGTPPPPTPSNLSTPPSPSTSPKSRLRRVKMLARKTIASEALSKKLKAIQVQDSESNSDSESYKSASEGEGPGSSDSEKIQESPSKKFKKEKEREGACGEERGNVKRVVDHPPTTTDLFVPAICGVEQENVEESGKKSGGSGSGEADEWLVNLSTQGDEPGSSTEETLADLLKKVGRRATRSRVKQSESDFQKAPAESKKKEKAYYKLYGPSSYGVSGKWKECEAKDTEIARLKARVAEVESERDAVKIELTKEKENNDGILHNMLNLLQAQNQPSSSPKP
ncbi:uncharacterized protein [Nicotiana sylvestris]|uniref:uncharacterized protein n=1 Tax=Nicotiana sylvestris TaxID=4096 RepID=UPI00388CBDF8